MCVRIEEQVFVDFAGKCVVFLSLASLYQEWNRMNILDAYISVIHLSIGTNRFVIMNE